MQSLTSQQRLMVMLELLGGPKYARDMRAASASTTTLGKATKATGAEMAVGSRRTFLMNQALYTLRRYSFYATTALLGATAAVVKLGYGYLSALQNARVALSPVIKDTAKLTSYLNQLFSISKYSPFVITNMAIAFRTMFAQMSHIGIGGQKIVSVLKALSDYLSFTGHTTPADLNRVAGALAKMANLGRLTGRTILQLAAGGVPIYDILNKKLGITRDQLSNISKLNIPPGSVLAAILSYAKTDKGVNGAAQRLALHSFSGLLQVGRDTLSQLSGNLIKPSYAGGQGFLGRLLGPNGSLNKIANFSNNHSPSATIQQISRSLTGGSGLGRGFLLLFDIVKQFARVITNVLVPALMIALHTLIIFWPILIVVDKLFKFMANHGKIFAWVISILAAEFVIAHANLILLGGGMKLAKILTFGSIGGFMSLFKALKILRIEGFSGLAKAMKEWAFAQKASKTALGAFTGMVYTNDGTLAKFTRRVVGLIKKLKELRAAMIGAGLLDIIGAAAAAVAIPAAALAGESYFGHVQASHITHIGAGTVTSKGKTYAIGGGRVAGVQTSDTVIHTHVHVDGKEIANAVDRVKANQRARK